MEAEANTTLKGSREKQKVLKQNVRMAVLNKRENEVYLLKARPANVYVRRCMRLFHEG